MDKERVTRKLRRDNEKLRWCGSMRAGWNLYITNFGGKSKQKGHWFILRRGTHNSKKLQRTKKERTRKYIIRIFKQIGFKIEIKTNLKEVDFLDVTFSLKKETHQPFRKENDKLFCIHTSSKHPPPLSSSKYRNPLPADYPITLPMKSPLTVQKKNMRSAKKQWILTHTHVYTPQDKKKEQKKEHYLV